MPCSICQTCQGCQNACQYGNCESACQSSCLSACEVANLCGACQTGCQDCQNACQYGNCQSVCQGDCQSACEQANQDLCQRSCQCAVQSNQCGACQTGCQTYCEIDCEHICESECQSGCQTGCQCSTQGCQDACQNSCQCSAQGCQDACQHSCESACQITDQDSDPVYEPEYIHYGTEGINPGSGNYCESFTDMSLDSPGFKLNISRSYNSKDERPNRPFGRGWTFGFEGKVEGDSTISVRLPNGGSFMFTKNANGTYTPSDSKNRFEKASDGTYTLTTKDQYKYKFNSVGYLISMSDKNNNTITIDVDATGKVKAISNATMQQYVVTYNTDGLIDTITEQASQRRIKYEYQNKLLFKVTDSMGYYVTYSYDGSSYLNEIKDQIGSILSKMEYDHISSNNLHKLTKITDSFGNVKTYTYSTSEKYTTITDSNGRATTSWHDSNNYVIKTQDPEGRITTTEYYQVDNTNKYGEEKIHIDRYGNKTEYIRDATGNITKLIHPDLSFEEYQYDDKNNKIFEKDEIGNVTYFIYDTLKINLMKKVQPLNGKDVYTETADQALFAITKYEYYTDLEAQTLAYKSLGLLKSTTTPEGNTTIYTYDAVGNIKTVKDPETQKLTTYEYNTIGLKTAEISPKGFRTEFKYNKNMELHKTILKSENSETTVITYDNRGRMIKEISPNQYNLADDTDENNYTGNYGHRFEYYPSDLLWKETDAENNTTVYTYDVYGNKRTETRPDGAIFEYIYDVINRLKKILFKENLNAISVLLEEFFYEVLPDKRTQTTHRVYFSSSEYADTKHIYDYEERLVATTNADGTTVKANYNANGTINSMVDEKGKVTYFKYDGLNRLTEKWTPFEEVAGTTKYSYFKIEYYKDGNKKSEKVSADKVDAYAVPSNLIVTNYEYYKNGKLKKVSDTAGRIKEYQYDDDGDISRVENLMVGNQKSITAYENNYLNLLSKKTVYVAADSIYGDNAGSLGVTSLVTTYTYDKNKNLKTETAPDNITTTYVYDNMNRRTEVREPGLDENGVAVTIIKKISYNFEGKVQTVTDPNEKVTTNVYNKRGFLEKVINPDTGVIAYAYDLVGRKTDEVMPNSYEGSKTIQQMNRKVYKYDLMGRVLTSTEVFDEKKYNEATGVWNTNLASKVTKAYKYDEKGRLIKELDGIGFDTSGGATTIERINNGYGTEYKYNLSDDVIEMLDPVSKEKGLPYTVKNEYDALGRKTKEIDALGRVKRLEYDMAGNVKTVKHQDALAGPEIALESKTYDLHGNVRSVTDGNGSTITFIYNEIDKLRWEKHPSDETIPRDVIVRWYDVVGNLKSKVDKALIEELYTYDNEGRVLTKTERKSDGTAAITLSIRYDKTGNPRFEVDGNGNTTEKTYDSMNRVKTITTKVKNINNVEIVHATSINYDKNGNKISETDWRGNTVTFVYDGINRLVEKIDPYAKSIERLEYNKNDAQIKVVDALNNVTIFEYDKNNRLIKTTDSEKHTTAQSFDEVGNLKIKTDGRNNVTTYNYDGLNRLQSVINAKGETTSYTYDAVGNVLTETDGKGNITTFEYGARNVVKRRIDQGGRSLNGNTFTYVNTKVESYTYFANGKVNNIIDRNGITTTFQYDIHGKLITKVAGQSSISYTYDSNGNILTMTDITGVTERKYDSLNRVIEKSSTNIGKTVYEYDIITGVEAGETGEKVKDPKGNITLKVTDRLGRIKKVTAEEKTTTYEYFDNGNKKSVQYQDGSREEFTYYTDNRLKTLVNKKADGSILESYSYTYDGAHNQTSKIDKRGTTSYTYDSLNRLERITEPSGDVTSYEFDKAGNRAKETFTPAQVKNNVIRTITDYSYNEQNRLMRYSKVNKVDILSTCDSMWESGPICVNCESIQKPCKYVCESCLSYQMPKEEFFATSIEGTSYAVSTSLGTQFQTVEEINYSYDSNGNLINENKTSGTITNLYDEFNQLKETTSGGITVRAKYNAEGRRVEKEVNGVKTRFLYEGDKITLELSDTGAELARNVYGTNLIQRKMSGKVLQYFYNGHADVTALIDDIGVVVASYYYDAFGNIVEETGTAQNPYRYSGYEYDKETKNYYLQSRYYNPKIARFLSEDTYRGDRKDPLSLNLYTYCHNEPLMYVDPDGHRPESQTGNGANGPDKRYAEKMKKAYTNFKKLPTPKAKPVAKPKPKAVTKPKSTNKVGVKAAKSKDSKHVEALVGMGTHKVVTGFLESYNAPNINVIKPQKTPPAKAPVSHPLVLGVAIALKIVMEPITVNDVPQERQVDLANEALAKYKSQPNSKVTTDEQGRTIIYRSATGTVTSMTPRPLPKLDTVGVDSTGYKRGLSFQFSEPDGSYYMTTLEQINSTFKLIAIPDDYDHVSVRPILDDKNNSRLKQWADTRSKTLDNPKYKGDPLTQLLFENGTIINKKKK